MEGKFTKQIWFKQSEKGWRLGGSINLLVYFPRHLLMAATGYW